MKFDIYCNIPSFDKERIELKKVKFVYDNMTSEIFDDTGKLLEFETEQNKNYGDIKNFPTVSEKTPLGKSNIETLKIQLGLSCNYSCEYCSQRFVPHVDDSNMKFVDKFIDNMDSWLKEEPKEIEFWGGEPFAYYKIMKPLAEKLREKFPNSKFLVITNGSLLTYEIIDWLEELNFNIGISHDGPGQKVRGPDPFDDPKQKDIILTLYHRFRLKNRVSFNSMIHRENMDRAKIQQFFIDFTGDKNVIIGEGAFIDAYDEGGIKNSLQDRKDELAFRRLTMHQLIDETNYNFSVVNKRMVELINSFKNRRPARLLGQKCGMDNEKAIAVDLRGNVLTCQNVSAASTAPNGRSHLIGHVSKLDKVQLNTATHWSFRKECMGCPVLQSCKGSCMFLQKELFDVSCNNAYSDHIPFFAAAFEAVTGAMPYAVIPQENEEEFPASRADIWGPSDFDAKPPKVREEINV
jgi:uncharacterized protein